MYKLTVVVKQIFMYRYIGAQTVTNHVEIHLTKEAFSRNIVIFKDEHLKLQVHNKLMRDIGLYYRSVI